MIERKWALISLLLVASLVLLSVPAIFAKPPSNVFTPNYIATFTGDIQGGGVVEVLSGKTGFKEIHSDVHYNNYPLTFAAVFKGCAGSHMGYVYIITQRGPDRSLREFYYTYGPEGEYRDYYQLHGFGYIIGDENQGWFTFTSTGSYTISMSGPSTGWKWVEIWAGNPQFTMSGEKLT